MIQNHSLTGINEETRTGQCSYCGEVKVDQIKRRNKYSYVCDNTPKVKFKLKSKRSYYESTSVARKFIYLIKSDIPNSPTKIGIASNVPKRLKTLQMASPCKLELIFTIEKTYAYQLENTLHQYFKDKKVHGEWFDLNEEDIQLAIDTLSSLKGC
jgi:ssDNA-binding Zn-finger/Zn-ribbon topoisomerase 1